MMNARISSLLRRWSHTKGASVLAFGLGIVLGLSLDTVPAVAAVPVVVDEPSVAATAEPVTTDRWAADEPLAAERDAALAAEPHTVVVGRSDGSSDET